MFSKKFLANYKELQEKYADCVTLVRLNDFYFAFYESANKVADTIKQVILFNGVDEDSKSVTAISFPHYELDAYLPKLIRANIRVAIADFLTAPPA